MRHYALIPVRYNAQQLLVRCEPVEAELWSIQWHQDKPPFEMAKIAPDLRPHWFADVSPLELEEAKAIVVWLNNRQSMMATLPPLVDIVRPFNRSK